MLGGLQAGPRSPEAGKRWPPTPGIQVLGHPSSWALPLPKVLQLLGRGLPGAREREQGGMWALLGDVIVGRERRQNLEHLGADEHPWGSLSPTSLRNSSIQKGQSLPIKLGSHQPTRQPARIQGLQAEDRNLVQPRRGPDLRRQQFTMGQALWKPHVLRGKSMGPTTVLLRRGPIGRVGNRGPQMRNEQRSVPSKDKGKCGPAL